MASKVFMTELFEERPNHTYIDIGSTFDGLIKHSRDFNGTKLYRDVLLKCYSGWFQKKNSYKIKLKLTNKIKR